MYITRRRAAFVNRKRKKSSQRDLLRSKKFKKQRSQRAEVTRQAKTPKEDEVKLAKLSTPEKTVAAYKRLSNTGWLQKPAVCPACHTGKLVVPGRALQALRGSGGDYYFRCTHSACKAYHNVLKFAKFLDRASKLPVAAVEKVCQIAMRSDKAPSHADVAKEVGLGTNTGASAVKNVLQGIRHVEAKAALNDQAARKLSGILEADATGLRKIRSRALKKNKYLQVFAFARRATPQKKAAFNLYFLPVAVVSSGAVPPVESEARVEESGALECVEAKTPEGKKTRLVTDGAELYPKIAEKLKIAHHSCAHYKGIFNKQVSMGRDGALQVNTGYVDNLWKLMKKAVPSSLVSSYDNETFNLELMAYVRSWQWRYHRSGEDLYVALGKYMRSLD